MNEVSRSSHVVPLALMFATVFAVGGCGVRPMTPATPSTTTAAACPSGQASTTPGGPCSATGKVSVTFAPPKWDFGDIAIWQTTEKHEFSVVNTGTAPIKRIEVEGQPPPDFEIVDDQCTEVIKPKSSCTMTITYTPQMSGKFKHDFPLTFGEDGGTETKTFKFKVTGTVDNNGGGGGTNNGGGNNTGNGGGTNNGNNTNNTVDVSVSPGSHDFGQVSTATSANQEFVFTNNGNAAINGPGDAVALGDGFTESDGCANTTLNAGDSCSVFVDFVPNDAKAYASSGTLTFTDGNGNSDSATFSVSGTGTN